MPNSRRERIVTVSGKNGYFQLTSDEQKAYSIAFFFSATNVGNTNYYSYEWYKERTLYGRFKVARGEYTLREHLLQYQNECIYEETATLYETVKRLQCERQRQYKVNKFVVESLITIGNASNVALNYYSGGSSYDEIPPQPIEIPGLQVDGLYYSMFPGCAGEVTVQTWYDDDVCKDVNGNDLTKDNRGKPPDPKVAGRPPSGNDTNVPAPTFPPGSTYSDPNPGQDVPTDNLSNPVSSTGIPNTLYRMNLRDTVAATGEIRGDYSVTVLGRYTGIQTAPINNGSSRSYFVMSGIGSQANPAGVKLEVGTTSMQGAINTPYSLITILSVVPQ